MFSRTVAEITKISYSRLLLNWASCECKFVYIRLKQNDSSDTVYCLGVSQNGLKKPAKVLDRIAPEYKQRYLAV